MDGQNYAKFMTFNSNTNSENPKLKLSNENKAVNHTHIIEEKLPEE